MDKTIGWNENDTDVIDPVVRPLERAGHQFIRLHTMREALDAMDTMRQANLILLDTTLPPADTPYDTDEETALPSCIFCISYARCQTSRPRLWC